MNIIQRTSLPIYQQLSTFLLQVYRAKYLLQRISPQAIGNLQSGRHRQLSYKLRQRLIWFADLLRAYLTETVIAAAFADMLAAIRKAEDIDEMSTIHMKYIARLQDQALLSDNLRPIHRAIISLLDLSVLFSQHHARARRDADATSVPLDQKPKPARRKPPASRHAAVVATSDSSSSAASGDDEDAPDVRAPPATQKPAADALAHVDGEFSRLLPFITAGLRSVGRVGAEPVWEMLAEKMAWEGRKEV